jgi:hypothetical protein
MLELRHAVPEIVRIRRVAAVNLSTDPNAGQDVADKVEFWSPDAVVDLRAAEEPDGIERELIIIVHEGLLYQRGGRLRRAVKVQLVHAPLVVSFDLSTQRAWRIDRAGYRRFAARTLVYPYVLAVVRRLPTMLRRPLLGAR